MTKNTTAYLLAHQARMKQVKDFTEIARYLESSYGKFLGYLLFSNLNLSVEAEHMEVAAEFELDESRNQRAREKELVQGAYVLRKEFVEPLRAMKHTATDLLKEELNSHESVFVEMFVALIGQFETGELGVNDVHKAFAEAGIVPETVVVA